MLSITEIFLFTLILLVTLVIATSLSAVELNVALSLDVFNALIDLVMLLAGCFAYCYGSDCVTLGLLEVSQIFYDSSWYYLAAKKQKLLVLPIQRAQREFRLRGLGLIDCSMVVYSSVRSKVILYYDL